MISPVQLSVSIDDQKLELFRNGTRVREFVVSTALKGMGTTCGSFRTPTGTFRICEKIGAGEPVGRMFRARQPVGQWNPSQAAEDDLILTRILRLDGLDDANANTLERCIYLHGTNREDLLGVPASHGCVRMGNEDIVDLFEQVEVGDGLRILPATRRRGSLLFLDGDALLSQTTHPLVMISEWISEAKKSGWLPVLLSDRCGLDVCAFAADSAVAHVEQTNESGMITVIREWIQAVIPERTMLVSHMQTCGEIRGEVDHLVDLAGAAAAEFMLEKSDRCLAVSDSGSPGTISGDQDHIGSVS